jgi:flagellar biosynthetic protein FliQ
MNNYAQYVQLAREALWLVVVLSLLPLMASLVVGLIISFFQALTQIQEQTLTFVPKIIVTIFVILLTANYMIGQLTIFSEKIFKMMIDVGRPLT